MVIVYTIENNYQTIDELHIKINNPDATGFLSVYGTNIQDSDPYFKWYEINLGYLQFQSKNQFTIEFKMNLNDLMKMCCVPISYEISCLKLDNFYVDYKNTHYVNDSFKVILTNVFFTAFL